MAAAQNPSRTQLRPGGLVRPGLSTALLPTVELDPRTAYDFLTSVWHERGELDDLLLDDILPEDRTWIEESRAALAAEMGSGTFVETCSGFVAELGRMLVGHPEIRSAADVVAAVETLTDQELLENMAGELLEDPDLSSLTRRALDGDGQAYEELQTKLESFKGHPVIDRPMALLAPTGRAILRAWLPRYQLVEARVERMLERDIAGRKADDATGDPLGFVERTTNGIRLVADDRIRHIILAPSYFNRPYNTLRKIGDVRIVCYPIADSALGAADRVTPPASTVRLYRALGDPSRLRILRLLAQRDRYLTEIANELDLTKPTIKHHLAQLRSAGLITVTEQGNFTYYALRPDRAEEAGVELRAYLAR